MTQKEKRKSLLVAARAHVRETDEIAVIENVLVLETERKGRPKINDEEDRDQGATVLLNRINQNISTISKTMRR